jgi:predicted SAM-dependent methyltransferase
VTKRLHFFLAKRITTPQPAGFRSTLAAARSEALIRLCHRWIGLRQARKFHGSTRLKLHLGCGPNIKSGWVNIDLVPGADLALDLRKPLPFDGGSCSLVYSEHVLEHLQYPDAARSLLKECWRVLEPGGLLSTAVPDGELALRSYVLGGTEAYYAAKRKWRPAAECETPIELVNLLFRQFGEHQFIYDFETLNLLLRRCGFIGVVRRNFDPKIDREWFKVESLYVDCIKPPLRSQSVSDRSTGATVPLLC